ncbi:MAG: hypothetical protein WAQ28_17075 [Bacteroidia bacterium]|jgi:hypothetical protein
MIKKISAISLVCLIQTTLLIAQNTPTTPSTLPQTGDQPEMETGISVSPSTLRFNAKPGTTQTKTIKITNDTKKKITYQVNFQDYGLSADGQQDVGVKSDYRNALSKYVVVSPTLIELNAHEAKTISVTLDIPPGDAYAIAMWTTLIIDQVLDRPKMQTPGTNTNTMGMGISTGMSFGVNIFQNPPNVAVNSVEIQSMKYVKANLKQGNTLVMKAKNTGDGIGYCLYYIELTSMLTGRQSKLKVKQFSIFPGYEKELSFELPKELEKGKYSALAVLDFGNKDELQTAEIEFLLE